MTLFLGQLTAFTNFSQVFVLFFILGATTNLSQVFVVILGATTNLSQVFVVILGATTNLSQVFVVILGATTLPTSVRCLSLFWGQLPTSVRYLSLFWGQLRYQSQSGVCRYSGGNYVTNLSQMFASFFLLPTELLRCSSILFSSSVQLFDLLRAGLKNRELNK